MRQHDRNTLSDFAQTLTAADVEALIQKARGRKTYGDHRPFATVFGTYTHQEIALPEEVITAAYEAVNGQDTQAIANQLNTWLQSASEFDRTMQICSVLLERTETLTSDSIWAKGFASELTRVFGAPSDLGLKTIETPAHGGQRWTLLVAKATAKRLLPKAA